MNNCTSKFINFSYIKYFHLIFRRKMVLCFFYIIIVTFLALIPNMSSKDALYANISITLSGGIETREASIISFIAYYCIKFGVIFFAFSMIADERKEIGRYIFARSKSRSGWLFGQYFSLCTFTFVYWFVIYFLDIAILWLSIGTAQFSSDINLDSMIVNWLNTMVFLFIANYIAQWIDERIALLITLGLFLTSDLVLYYSSKVIQYWTIFLPTVWGRYSIISSFSSVVLGIIFNLIVIIAVVFTNSKSLQKSDIY